MVVSLPQATDPLNAPDHSKLHRVVAGDLAAPDQMLSITNGVVDVLASSKFRWNAADLATDYLLEMRVAGDTDPRFLIRADGQLEWGGGAGATDIAFYRMLGNILATESVLRAYGSRFECTGGLTTVPSLLSSPGGWINAGFELTRDGTMKWGSGAAVADCYLSRNAANELRTPDQLTVQGGVATLIKAGVPGDGDFATAVDGLLAIDTTTDKLHYRSSGAWWALTGV